MLLFNQVVKSKKIFKIYNFNFSKNTKILKKKTNEEKKNITNKATKKNLNENINEKENIQKNTKTTTHIVVKKKVKKKRQFKKKE